VKRHVSAYLEAFFRFTKCWLIETDIGTVWLDVEISSSAQYSGVVFDCPTPYFN
jgi:hypothetical protein